MIVPDDKTPLFPYAPFRPSVVWNFDIPPHGDCVTAFTITRSGPRTLPFRVIFRDGAWRNAATGRELECEIAGWREGRA